MAVFPMGIWPAFVIVTSWFYGITSVTTTVPSTVYIGKTLVYLLTDSTTGIIHFVFLLNPKKFYFSGTVLMKALLLINGVCVSFSSNLIFSKRYTNFLLSY